MGVDDLGVDVLGVDVLRGDVLKLDVMVLSLSNQYRGGDVFNHKQGSIAHSLSLSPAHCPDITEILLKRM